MYAYFTIQKIHNTETLDIDLYCLLYVIDMCIDHEKSLLHVLATCMAIAGHPVSAQVSDILDTEFYHIPPYHLQAKPLILTQLNEAKQHTIDKLQQNYYFPLDITMDDINMDLGTPEQPVILLSPTKNTDNSQAPPSSPLYEDGWEEFEYNLKEIHLDKLMNPTKQKPLIPSSLMITAKEANLADQGTLDTSPRDSVRNGARGSQKQIKCKTQGPEAHTPGISEMNTHTDIINVGVLNILLRSNGTQAAQITSVITDNDTQAAWTHYISHLFIDIKGFEARTCLPDKLWMLMDALQEIDPSLELQKWYIEHDLAPVQSSSHLPSDDKGTMMYFEKCRKNQRQLFTLIGSIAISLYNMADEIIKKTEMWCSKNCHRIWKLKMVCLCFLVHSSETLEWDKLKEVIKQHPLWKQFGNFEFGLYWQAICTNKLPPVYCIVIEVPQTQAKEALKCFLQLYNGQHKSLPLSVKLLFFQPQMLQQLQNNDMQLHKNNINFLQMNESKLLAECNHWTQ